MIATDTIETAIVDKIKALHLFGAVEPYPLQRMRDETFPHDLVKLKLPCALLILLGDTQEGRPSERRINWSLILIQKDSTPAASKWIAQAVDKVRSDVLGQALTEKTHLRPDSRMSVLQSKPAYSAVLLTLLTVEHA